MTTILLSLRAAFIISLILFAAAAAKAATPDQVVPAFRTYMLGLGKLLKKRLVPAFALFGVIAFAWCLISIELQLQP